MQDSTEKSKGLNIHININLFETQSSESNMKLTCCSVEAPVGVFMGKGRSASAFRCSGIDRHLLFVKDGRGSLQVSILSVTLSSKLILMPPEMKLTIE